MTLILDRSERKHLLGKGMLQLAAPVVAFMLMVPMMGIGPCGPSLRGPIALMFVVGAFAMMASEVKAVHNFRRAVAQPFDRLNLPAIMGALLGALALAPIAMLTFVLLLITFA